jgi:hypothetical protein
LESLIQIEWGNPAARSAAENLKRPFALNSPLYTLQLRFWEIANGGCSEDACRTVLTLAGGVRILDHPQLSLTSLPHLEAFDSHSPSQTIQRQ